jgi:hypothetical protein
VVVEVDDTRSPGTELENVLVTRSVERRAVADYHAIDGFYVC